MYKRILLIASVALSGLGLALGLLLGGGDDNAPPLVRVAESIYGNKYDSLEEMLARKDAVVVVGRVTSAYASKRIGDGVLFTDRLVHVDEVLYGSLASPDNKQIPVRQTGGTVGRETLKVVDAKLLMRDEQVVLVLHYDSTFHVYWIKGGGDGYFLMDGRHLRHANHDSTDHPLATFAGGVNAKSLRSVFADSAPD